MKKPKPINLLLPGFAKATGRKDDRFRASSGTNNKDLYEGRHAMVKDLARRKLWTVLQGVLDDRFSMERVYNAYRADGRKAKGETLDDLKREAQGRLLKPLYRQWQKEYRRTDRDATFERLERFFDAHGGMEKATTDALTAAHVAAFLADLTAKNHKEPTPASPATRNRYRAAISVFSTWLVARHELAEHPIAFKAVPKDTEPEGRMPVPFSFEEHGAYFEAIRAERPDFALVFLMLIHTGADISEVLSRRVADVDLERGLVRYRRTKTKTPERAVPIDAVLRSELRGHIAAWSMGPSEVLFGMFDRAALETVHAHAATAIKRPDLWIKDLRHLAAIAWVRAGVPLPTVQKYLGHATLSQTMVYANFAPTSDEHEHAAERAAALMRGPSNVVPISRARAQETA